MARDPAAKQGVQRRQRTTATGPKGSLIKSSDTSASSRSGSSSGGRSSSSSSSRDGGSGGVPVTRVNARPSTRRK